MDIPPSLLSVLDPEQTPASLETIIIGGEVCAAQVVRKWARKFRVVNVYGPTEVTVCTSFCECNSERWSRPLIGCHCEYQLCSSGFRAEACSSREVWRAVHLRHWFGARIFEPSRAYRREVCHDRGSAALSHRRFGQALGRWRDRIHRGAPTVSLSCVACRLSRKGDRSASQRTCCCS